MERVHELRDLVHDHLGPRRDLHDLRPGLERRRPIAISIGWPVICVFVLLVAVSMSELTSAFPTAGGPYWWAARLGGAGWSWFTGWFNIVGLIGIVASVGLRRGELPVCAARRSTALNIFGVDFGDDVARPSARPSCCS